MANKALFQSSRGPQLPAADTRNEAGGLAYRMDARHALAQYVTTGCLNQTYYASAEVQLKTVLKLCERVPADFVARAAVYGRSKGQMKDMPALLCAILAKNAPVLLPRVFERVIDSPKMLRNFVQVLRSGVTGRKSLGSMPKRLVQRWLAARTDEQLFNASVGQAPSLADIVKMVHPKPETESRKALYGYLLSKSHDAAALPEIVRAYEAFKANCEGETPDVPFQMLTSLPLNERQWRTIASRASWQTTRMNLNTFARHNVFACAKIEQAVAARLRDEKSIRAGRALPYQLMTAYAQVGNKVPNTVREALQGAMEVAISNVPAVPGQVYVFPDISGSMQSPVTGVRKGATSAVRCLDVAALVAAAMVRMNRSAVVVPFSDHAIAPETVKLNPRDSVMTNAQKLAALPSGGTNCSAPLALLNERKATGDLIVYVSDNESWIDSRPGVRAQATQTLREWELFRKRSPQARMVCIDVQPNASTQAPDRDDIINVGGFSDAVFDVIATVARGEATTGYWVSEIEKIEL